MIYQGQECVYVHSGTERSGGALFCLLTLAVASSLLAEDLFLPVDAQFSIEAQ
jgi:hypothetical protein